MKLFYKLLEMSKIEVTKKEEQSLLRELAPLIAVGEQIKNAEVFNEEEKDFFITMRKDEEGESVSQSVVLENAPSSEKGFFFIGGGENEK